MTKNVSKSASRSCLLVAVLGAAGLVAACDRTDQKAYGEGRPGDPQPTERTPPTEVDRDRTQPGFPVPEVERGGERAQRPTEADPSDVARPAVSKALSSISEARCERETRCNNIGKGKRFETRNACMDKVKGDKLEGLNSEECKGGVDQKELNECLAEIRNEDCKNPLDTLGRVAACRSSDLCKATVAPNK